MAIDADSPAGELTDMAACPPSGCRRAITKARMESRDSGRARVLFAVTARTTTVGTAEQESTAWRMRIMVPRGDNSAKVSYAKFMS